MTEPSCARGLSHRALVDAKRRRAAAPVVTAKRSGTGSAEAALAPTPETPARQPSMVRQASRTERMNQRRLVNTIEEELEGVSMSFNQLKLRRRNLSFRKSAIHDWGLFAEEEIPADTMVIEYVGEVVRQIVADERERRYESLGIGSSYLFRVDERDIVDATRVGSMARFMNHCCEVRACCARQD